MRNRLVHRPELRSSGAGHERKVGWLELFYDLVFVATVIQLGEALSHRVDVGGFLAFAGLFAPVWFLWTGFTFFANRFDVDDAIHRGLVFLQMFGVGAMAVCVPDVLSGDGRWFALAYSAARLSLALLYWRTFAQVPQSREFSRRWSWLFTADAAVWLISAWLPTPWMFVMWAVGVGINVSIPVSKASRDLATRHPPDVLHISERYGLLTIIVLGESFVKLLGDLGQRSHVIDEGVLLTGVGAALVTFCLWWIYFDDVAGSRIKRHRGAAILWIYAHLPLTMSIAGVGVAIKQVLDLTDPFGPVPAKYRWLLCGTLALALTSVAVIDVVTERRHAELRDRARIQARSAATLLLLVVAPAGFALPAWGFVMLVTGVCVLQVVFDLVLAPMAEPHAHVTQDGVQPLEPSATRSRDAAHGRAQRLGTGRRFDVGDAVRLGTPNELRRDLYFSLMEGGWARVFGILAIGYLFVNVVFAALYLLDPGGVANVRPNSFSDAFFFSVQTMSTIGYGVMAPGTTFSNVLVTIEAAVGVLGVALATGLMFAKASRPRASVLFSDVAVVTVMDGVPTLVFRVGNGRGNDVVDATMRVAALVEQETAEGHVFRRLYDLDLVRTRQPVFVLSWTVMHPIVPGSPLYGVDLDEADGPLAGVIATMTGHDSTYAQTIHARTLYYPERILNGRRFVDVISFRADGRPQIDYGVFHDTIADAAVGDQAAEGPQEGPA